MLLFTAIQGIAQRGGDESENSVNRGNFLELVNLLEYFNDDFKQKRQSLPNNSKYTSPSMQNEILTVFGQMVRDKISNELQKCEYFAIMVDETKDISKIEQLSVVLRYYLNGIVYERFMGFRAASSLCATSLFTYIKEILAVSNVDIKKCVGQTYDGASVMSGKFNGVQALFRKEVPQAIYVHCYNHRLNLVIADTCKNVPGVRMFFDLIESLYVFISGSSIHAQFVDIQNAMKLMPKVELKRICLTRWTAQVFACLTMKKALSPLLVLLHKLVYDRGDRSVEATGLLHQIDFKFIFNLVMFCYILHMFKGVSDYLQNTSGELANALILISSLESTLQDMRLKNTDTTFNNIYAETMSICDENNITIPSQDTNVKRKKTIPKHFEQFIFTQQNTLEVESPTSKIDLKTKLYYIVIDYILVEIKNRFSDNKDIISAVSYLHPGNEHFLSFTHIQPLAKHYGANTDVLKSELNILPNTIKTYELQNNTEIKTMMKLLELLEKYKLAFIETHKIVQIIITIPISSAGCERTFSCLRRLKNYLRSLMTNERFVQ